jgi:general stress protein 26
MAGKYPRRRQIKSMSELTERQWRIYHFLRAHPIGVLATVTPENEPHGTVIYYSIDKHFDVFFVTKSQTRKNDNLKHNKHVMLTVFEASSQTIAQIIGTARESTDDNNVSSVAVAGAKK